jgi:membrane protease YdiL (CAAX protease family)
MSMKKTIIQKEKIEQHSIGKSLLLHLGPGFVISMIYFIFVPTMNRLGIPPFLVLMILVLLLLIPFELGYLLYQAKKKNGSLSLRGIVVYREPLHVWQIIVMTLLLLAWVYFMLVVVFQPIEKPIINAFFSWVPNIYFFETFINQLDQYTKFILLITSITGILVNGLFGPIVEELYFRGYLLPRISHYGIWAPFLHTVLFALYHFFTPWQNLLRIVAFLPICYSVWWKKSIIPGILVHCIMNLIGTMMMLIAILKL